MDECMQVAARQEMRALTRAESTHIACRATAAVDVLEHERDEGSISDSIYRLHRPIDSIDLEAEH